MMQSTRHNMLCTRVSHSASVNNPSPMGSCIKQQQQSCLSVRLYMIDLSFCA